MYKSFSKFCIKIHMSLQKIKARFAATQTKAAFVAPPAGIEPTSNP